MNFPGSVAVHQIAGEGLHRFFRRYGHGPALPAFASRDGKSRMSTVQFCPVLMEDVEIYGIVAGSPARQSCSPAFRRNRKRYGRFLVELHAPLRSAYRFFVGTVVAFDLGSFSDETLAISPGFIEGEDT